ncbi:MAG: hypothetical protein ACI8Q1_003107 [Parvicella sp.]
MNYVYFLAELRVPFYSTIRTSKMTEFGVF